MNEIAERPVGKSVSWPLCFLLMAGATAASSLKDENLIQPLPTGYQVGFQNEQDGMETIEYVPKDQGIHDWTDMITTQILRGRGDIPPTAYLQTLEEDWSRACPGSDASSIREGEENGYAFALWQFSCPLNPSTGKPEYTWIKAIQGRDAFYLVQKAFKSAPEKEALVPWIQYLSKIMVCDTRAADRACPAVRPASR